MIRYPLLSSLLFCVFFLSLMCSVVMGRGGICVGWICFLDFRCRGLVLFGVLSWLLFFPLTLCTHKQRIERAIVVCVIWFFFKKNCVLIHGLENQLLGVRESRDNVGLEFWRSWEKVCLWDDPPCMTLLCDMEGNVARDCA
jgi:hypothetical protein